MFTVLFFLSFSLLVVFAFQTLYLLLLSIAGLFYRSRTFPDTSRNSAVPVLILIPAYKEDAVIVQSARDALKQHYPAHLFEVMVIADSLQENTIRLLQQSGVRVLQVSFTQSTKSRALNEAIKQLDTHWKLIVVLDADNRMAPDFLNQITRAHHAGMHVMQAHRTALNRNTASAVLDGISEEMNNHIFCKGPQALACSSRLIGSGMVFEASVFCTVLPQIDAVGGFDKALELALISRGLHIHYLPEALVYDEKVSKPEVLVKQRTRWMAAQFHFLRHHWFASEGLARVQWRGDFLLKSLQLLMLPKIFQLVLFACGLFLSLGNSALSLIWILTFGLYLLAFAISFPASFLNRRSLRILALLPSLLFRMLKALPRLRGANQNFIHTPHEIN